jgi:hypothetical protein
MLKEGISGEHRSAKMARTKGILAISPVPAVTRPASLSNGTCATCPTSSDFILLLLTLPLAANSLIYRDPKAKK